ncbi:MAG: thioesterase family protein [Caulobacteraceae bacterium]|nr:thioesterase family protein [Caulobacteraceae bacterium]
MSEREPSFQPYEEFRSVVRAEWTDLNEHFNSVRYLDVFRDAFVQFLGTADLSVRTHPGGGTMFQGEAHVRYERELLVGAPILVRSWLVAADAKRLHHFHEMFHAEAGFRAATAEYLHLHITLETRRVGPMPADDAVGRRIVLAPPAGAPSQGSD